MMKKLTALMLASVMSLSLLAGCGKDRVAEEVFWFANSTATAVLIKMEDFDREIENWDNLTSDAELAQSIQWVMLPIIEEILEIIDEDESTTPEVKSIKDRYEKVWEKYQEGLQMMLLSLQLQDETIFSEAEEIMGEADELMNEYERALDELAREKDVEL